MVWIIQQNPTINPFFFLLHKTRENSRVAINLGLFFSKKKIKK